MENNKIVIAFCIVIVLVGGYFWFSPGEDKETKKPNEERSAAEINKDQIVSGFVEKYQPTVSISSGTIYTFQLEDELVKTGKRVIFTASLDDIFRKDGEVFIRFTPSHFSFLEPQIFYTLRGCSEKIDQLASQERDFLGEYVVVAEIVSIEKPIIKVEGLESSGDVELELSQSDTFLATGTCIDLTYLDDNGI